ncbi:1382_t:CDS:2, partial [Gigaspora rosea]
IISTIPKKKILMGEIQKHRKQLKTDIWDAMTRLSKVIRILQKSKEGSINIDKLQRRGNYGLKEIVEALKCKGSS